MKKLYIAALFMLISGVLFGQAKAKSRLGILPFAGGDGETVATLFSFQSEILSEFTVVPRTSAVNALVAEQEFQMGGYTDSDTIARLGRMLNADFVVSGFIRRLGDRNLIITTIVNVETFEQMAGDYREYRTVEDVPALLPDICRVIINASRRDTSKLPKLAVVPFNIANRGVNTQDAEALAQILSIEIGNAGKYAILPRTTAIQAAMKELEYQMSGATAEEEAKRLGRAVNAEYVLSAEARSLGNSNMFTASILHVEDGSLLAGGYRNYRVLDDGIRLMPELAGLLTSGKSSGASVSRAPRSAPARQVRPPKEPQEPKERKAIDPETDKAARMNSLGFAVGTTFAAPVFTATVQGTIAPGRYLFFELGMDVGLASGYADITHTSLYPFAHFAVFAPFTKAKSAGGGWYAGIGAGCMIATNTYTSDAYIYDAGEKISNTIFAADISTGFIFKGGFTLSYTLRTDFDSASNKLAVGYSYRFK